MALGAQQGDILLLILGQGAKLALLGLSSGAIFALLVATRLMESLLLQRVSASSGSADLCQRGHHSAHRCVNCHLHPRAARHASRSHSRDTILIYFMRQDR